MKGIIYIYILNIIIAELLMPYYQVIGIGIHLINLLAIILLITFGNIKLEIKNILQSLLLVILLRVVNLSVPQFFSVEIFQYPIIYGIMFIPIYLVIKSQYISFNELGINFKRLYIYLPIAIVIGAMMAMVEYNILDISSIIEKFELSDIIIIIIVMFVFIATVEEVIFRSILQTRIEKVFGSKNGILLSGGIFGIMCVSYGIYSEIIFAIIFGILLSYIFQKTRSLPFIISIRGITNVILFLSPKILEVSLMNVIANIASFPSEIIYIGGGLTTAFLIVSLLISLLLLDSIYWNKYVSDTFEICYYPLLLVFTMISIFKIISVTW